MEFLQVVFISSLMLVLSPVAVIGNVVLVDSFMTPGRGHPSFLVLSDFQPD